AVRVEKILQTEVAARRGAPRTIPVALECVDHRLQPSVAVSCLDQTEQRERVIGARLLRLEQRGEAAFGRCRPSEVGQSEAADQQQLVSCPWLARRPQAALRRGRGLEQSALLVEVECGAQV